MRPLFVRAGDTFFTRSNSLLGYLIRWGEESKQDPKAWTNHAGVVVESGWIGVDSAVEGATQLKSAIVVEALWKTRKGTWEGWKEGTEIRVFRPKPEYTEEEKSRFVADANHYVGDSYGWWKLGLFLAQKIWHVPFPQASFIDNRPICSYLAGMVNEAARKKNGWPGFGYPANSMSPDMMMDYALAHPEFWEEVKA